MGGGRGTSEGRSGGRERVKGDRQPANLIRPSRDFLVTPVVSASLSLIPLLLPFSAFFSLFFLSLSCFFFFPFFPLWCVSFGNVCTLKSRVVNDWLDKLSFCPGGEFEPRRLFFADVFSPQFFRRSGAGKGDVHPNGKTRCN